MDHPYRVAAPGDRILVSHVKHPNCMVESKNRNLDVDLVQINMSDFDVILGVDWFTRHYAYIDCRGKKVLFMNPYQGSFFY